MCKQVVSKGKLGHVMSPPDRRFLVYNGLGFIAREFIRPTSILDVVSHD